MHRGGAAAHHDLAVVLQSRRQVAAPGPLRRLYARYGIREGDGPAPTPPREPVLAISH